MVDNTRLVETDATGRLIWEGNASQLASLLITVDSAADWGLSDLSQALTPIAAQGTIVLDWEAFPPEVRAQGKIIRIFAKRQAAGTLKCYVNYIGVN